MAKDKTTFNISKNKNFSEWYTEVLQRAEVTDIRYGVKGFMVIRPWGARIIDKMYKIYCSALQRTGHDPVMFPTLIPEENFTKEADHVKGFVPEVFWLDKKQGDERLALRPTSETAFYDMYKLWIRSHRDLPMKLYQRGSVFRSETKATRPLIRTREFYWIEAHDAFATKKEAEAQVQEDIEMTQTIMGQLFGVPFIPMRRPKWDTFPGAEYTVGSDSIMPDGRVIQQPSTHMLGQNFSKAFDVTYTDEKEKKEHAWITCYGPAMSRILASVIATHGDDNGLILPFVLSPIQVVIIPHFSKKSNKKIMEACENLSTQFFNEHVDAYIDDTDKRPGEKFYHWEMKGVPLRIEIGEKELAKKEATIFIRDTKEKVLIKLDDIVEETKNLGAEYDVRLVSRAEENFKDIIVTCKNKKDIADALQAGNIARFEFVSMGEDGAEAAAFVEKELLARIMGTREDKKETPKGTCAITGKKAKVIAYAAKSY